MRVSGSINEEEESEGKLGVDSQRMDSRRIGVGKKTDQGAGQVDTCRSRIGAVDPFGLWEAEKSGTCHGVVLIEVI